MKAMILAAGLGERMRPLTETRAKPSLPLLNRPIIVQTLDYLKRHGVTEVVINLHHSPESIRGILGDGARLGLRIQYSEEPTILGTAGGLKKAERFLRGSGSFILANSDFVTDCDLGEVLASHRAARSLSTLVLIPARTEGDYGIVELDGSGGITRIAGRPPGEPKPESRRCTFTGLHVLEPEIFDAIPPGRKVEINREVYPELIESGRPIRGFLHPGFWRELGTPRLYLEGSLAVLRETVHPSVAPWRVADGIFLEQVTLPDDMALAPPLLVGKGTTIGKGCSLLGGVVIGRQSRIGNACALRSSVIWDGGRVGDGASLTDCIVTSGVYVPPRVSLAGKMIFRVEGYPGKKEGLERLGGCWLANF